MKIANIHIVTALCALLLSGNAMADPCTVESAKDDLSSSSTLRYVVEEFLNGRTDKPCSARGYEDGEYFDQSVGFLTDEANTSSKADVNGITLSEVLEFDMEHTAVIGNVSQDALDDAETDHASDVDYDPDGNASNDGDAYTKSGGEVKDYGMVVIDARDLGEDVNPFACSADSEDVYLRNVIVLTDSVTIDEVFQDCVKDGGNAWVCATEYDEGSDPRTDPDWCSRSWTLERVPFEPGTLRLQRRWYADRDGDGYGDPDDSIVVWSGDEAYDAGRDEYVTRDSSDCDDADEAVHPGATEICDGIDNDCDGVIDANATDRLTWYQDADADEYGNADVSQTSCEEPDGYVANGDDCDDSDSARTTDCSFEEGDDEAPTDPDPVADPEVTPEPDVDPAPNTDTEPAPATDPATDLDPDPDAGAGTSAFNGQLEGSIFAGGGCALVAAGGDPAGAPLVAVALVMVALAALLPLRILFLR